MAKENKTISGKMLSRLLNNIFIWGFSFFIIGATVLCDVVKKSSITQESCIDFWGNNIGKWIFSLWKRLYEILTWEHLDLEFFANNNAQMGILVAVMVVVWTFSINLSLSILDKSNNRYYGVEIRDLLKEYGHVRLVMLAISEVLQGFMMIVSVVWDLRHTIVNISFIQFYTMVVMFQLVFFIVSPKEILIHIEAECEKILNGEWNFSKGKFFPSMLKNIDYKHQSDLEELRKLLFVTKKVDWWDVEKKKLVFSNAVDITLCLKQGFPEKQQFMDFIEKWFYEEECGFIKRGILSVLLDWNELDALTDCDILIASMQETDKYERMLIWMFVYELNASMASGKQWRIKNCDELVGEIDWKREENSKLALEYWKELDDTMDKVYVLQKWILKNGGSHGE